MDLVGFVSYLRQFKADVLLFGLAAWGVSLLLQKTLLKKAGAKVQAFLPFALGTVLYAAYRLILFGVCDAAAESALAEGLTCGAFATALHVLLARTGAERAGGVYHPLCRGGGGACRGDRNGRGGRKRAACGVCRRGGGYVLPAPFRNAENVRRRELNTAKQETFC